KLYIIAFEASNLVRQCSHCPFVFKQGSSDNELKVQTSLRPARLCLQHPSRNNIHSSPSVPLAQPFHCFHCHVVERDLLRLLPHRPSALTEAECQDHINVF